MEVEEVVKQIKKVMELQNKSLSGFEQYIEHLKEENQELKSLLTRDTKAAEPVEPEPREFPTLNNEEIMRLSNALMNVFEVLSTVINNSTYTIGNTFVRYSVEDHRMIEELLRVLREELFTENQDV